MPTRNIVLTDHRARPAERLVRTGRYQIASEVLREGLQLVDSRKAEGAARLAARRKAARIGIAEIEGWRKVAFDSAEALDSDLAALADDAIGATCNESGAPTVTTTRDPER